MTDFTRRTHIVRISDAGKDKKPEEGNYIDVEVLDAIAFRIEGGKEVILKPMGGKAFIDDQTDGNNGKKPGNASRRSHIKRLKGDDGAELDVETLECAAFSDQNGGEWVLDMGKPGGVFDPDDGGSDGQATRRGHTEKITAPFGQGKKATSFVKMQRHDMLAFRREGGKEVILKAPSSDDPTKPDIPRAKTFLASPDSYDPADPDQRVPENKDENVYFAFVKDKSASEPTSKNFLLGDTKIITGPLWWIRKINVIGGFLEINWMITGPGTNPPNGALPTTIEGFASPSDKPISLVRAGNNFPAVKDPPPTPRVEQKVTDEMLAFYAYWTNVDPPVGPRVIPGSPAGPGRYLVWADALPYPPTSTGQSGFEGAFDSLGAAEAQAALLNADFPGRVIGVDNLGHPVFSGGSPPSHVITLPAGADPASYRYRGSQIFNLGILQPGDPKDKKKFKLTVKVPATSTIAYTFELRTYKNKHRDFKTDAKGKIKWDKGDEVDKFGISGVGSVDNRLPARSIEIEIDAAKLTITSETPTEFLNEEIPDADA